MTIDNSISILSRLWTHVYKDDPLIYMGKSVQFVDSISLPFWRFVWVGSWEHNSTRLSSLFSAIKGSRGIAPLSAESRSWTRDPSLSWPKRDICYFMAIGFEIIWSVQISLRELKLIVYDTINIMYIDALYYIVYLEWYS